MATEHRETAVVLVAHPDDGVVESLCTILDEAGYATQHVREGRACVDAAASGEFRVLLLGLGLADIDPLDALDAVRSVDPEIEPIVLAAEDEEAGADEGSPAYEARRLYRRGKLEIVRFPGTDPMDMLPVVARALERRSARLKLRSLTASLEGMDLMHGAAGFREELEALARSKYEFLTLVSHELRTPITSLVSCLELMDYLDGEERARILEIIQREVRRMEHLVQEVDRHLQLRAGVVAPKAETVDLVTLVHKAANAVADEALKKSITLSCELPESATIRADPELLTDCLHRILENAIKFSDGDKTITVRLAADDAETSLVVLDRGHGVRFDRRARLFRPLEVSDVEHHTYGYGLGLAIVREQMSLLGGRVAYAPAEDGEGSVFRLFLPRS